MPEPPRAPHPVLKEYYRDADERPSFLAALFDTTARQYDRLCGLMSLGSGQWYRGWVLRRLGLRPGMRVLDVATGTGLVARAAAAILRDPRAVVGVDPSAGMLREARRTLPATPLAQGRVEQLPVRSGLYDFVTIGYALRHAADLDVAFRECRRILKPGGRVVVLEISRPASAVQRAALRGYLTRVLPLVMRITTGNDDARLLMRYYWETIDACVPPETILASLSRSGFADAHRSLWGGLLSEYVATNPPSPT